MARLQPSRPTWAHAVYSKTAYAPFGETYNEATGTGVTTADRSYTGQDQDVVTGSGGTGAYDFLFRKHDPSAGRWLSPDPSGWSATDPTNPQSLNRYAYALNNPVALVDPAGLDTICSWYQSEGGWHQQCVDTGGYSVTATDDTSDPNPEQDPGICYDFEECLTYTEIPAQPAPSSGNSNVMTFMNCVANGANKASLASLLPQNAPSLLKNLAGNDFASLQQLALGPNRLNAAVGIAEGKGANAIAQGIGSLPWGADTFTLSTNGAGTSYAIKMTAGKLANSALGTAVATLSAAKAAYDLGSYLAGFGTCSIWGK